MSLSALHLTEPPPVDDYDEEEHQAGDRIVKRSPDQAAEEAVTALRELLDVQGWPERQGQVEMVESVARAFAGKRHTLVSAPTGTGKSIGYLLPAVQQSRATGEPVVVVTATKALQHQIIDSDAPLLEKVFPGVKVALVKGRGNFICPSKLDAVLNGTEETLFDDVIDPAAWEDLLDWARTTESGDRAESPDGVSNSMWSKVSVGPKECVGASNCAFAKQCFAERSGAKAADADVVVTNAHLYLLAAQIGADGVLLPSHGEVVFDEGHKLAETAGRVYGVELRHGRGRSIVGQCRGLVKDETLEQIGKADDDLLRALMSVRTDGAVDPTVGDLSIALDDYRNAVKKALRAVNSVTTKLGDTQASEKKQRAANALNGAIEDINAILGADDDVVVWVEGEGQRKPILKLAPIEVGGHLTEGVFDRRTVVMCSATLTVGGQFTDTAVEVGLPEDGSTWDALTVESPFDHTNNGLLYIPMGRDRPLGRPDGSVLPPVEALVPGPNHRDFREKACQVTLRLIEAAEGRALLLFTSWQALNDTAEWLRTRIPYTMLCQGDKPTGRLLSEFLADEQSVLLMTGTGWEGISPPGPACSLVVCDRIPFPRKGDPLIDAMRDRATANRKSDFGTVDLPRAARQLAQGVGRLIRTVDDRGVVAVLDTRLGTKSYKGKLLASLPPFTRSIHLEEQVVPFLRQIADERRPHVGKPGPVVAAEDDSDPFDGIDEAA